MNPLIYGYVRALPGLSDQEIDRLRGDIAAFAPREGFALPEVFTAIRGQVWFASAVSRTGEAS